MCFIKYYDAFEPQLEVIKQVINVMMCALLNNLTHLNHELKSSNKK